MRFEIKVTERNGLVRIKFSDNDIPWYRSLAAALDGEEREVAKKVLSEMVRREALVTRTLTSRFGGAGISEVAARKHARRGFASTCKCHHPPLGHTFGGENSPRAVSCSTCGTQWTQHQYKPRPCPTWLPTETERIVVR